MTTGMTTEFAAATAGDPWCPTHGWTWCNCSRFSYDISGVYCAGCGQFVFGLHACPGRTAIEPTMIVAGVSEERVREIIREELRSILRETLGGEPSG